MKTKLHEYACGKYLIEIIKEDKWLEIKAAIGEEISVVNTVNGIMADILTEREMESGKFDNSPWEFPSIRRASRAFKKAQTTFFLFPKEIEKDLDEDREEGGWGFPSDKSKVGQGG